MKLDNIISEVWIERTPCIFHDFFINFATGRKLWSPLVVADMEKMLLYFISNRSILLYSGASTEYFSKGWATIIF